MKSVFCGCFTSKNCNVYNIVSCLQVLIEHIEEQNVDGYTDAIKDYDSVSRLDQWYTTILLRIKKQLSDNPDLR